MTAQIAIDFAAAQRDAGILRSSVHAENLSPGWADSACRMLADYAGQTESFTSEDFRDFLAGHGFPVPVPKALGAVFQKAARNSVIRRDGFAIAKQRHLSPCPLWRSAVYRGQE